MLDLFTIFTKGGIVLWCFRETKELFTPSVNALIRSVILQERTGSNSFDHQNLRLQYKLDNEFELIFVVAYQRILQLAYVDKFLSDVHLEFRDKYKNVLGSGGSVSGTDEAARAYRGSFEFGSELRRLLHEAEEWQRTQARIPKPMRTFSDSAKSKKTVASMIVDRRGHEEQAKAYVGKKTVKIVEEEQRYAEAAATAGGLDEDTLLANRRKLAEKLAKKGGKKSPKAPTSPNSPATTVADNNKKGKQARVWELGGNTKDLPILDRSRDRPEDARSDFRSDDQIIGTMRGVIQDLQVDESEPEDDDDASSSSDDEGEAPAVRRAAPVASNGSKKATGGMFAIFKGLVGAKNLTADDMQPALDKLRDHLIGKNVASDIAYKLCDSVAAKLEGRVLGTFDTIAATIRTSITDALVQILSPRRRVDILRDCLEAQRQRRPYVMTFCGVNGVGKSTNLAKICFWLIENNLSVLIAACDTFRAGAVEQLRTHTRHLNALHPAERHGGKAMVQLYEKGYGKDAAGIAMEAIRFAGDAGVDVVLVDTAGRMQDNEPLMRALGKLIRVNEPDLVLFVGEALVGNEAVDQLVKFNQALADYSASAQPHTIDGIVLTKFDTIDDKVGAAISMTYITGQPIVFVGTGQTYTDLKALNAKAVVQALMK